MSAATTVGSCAPLSVMGFSVAMDITSLLVGMALGSVFTGVLVVFVCRRFPPLVGLVAPDDPRLRKRSLVRANSREGLEQHGRLMRSQSARMTATNQAMLRSSRFSLGMLRSSSTFTSSRLSLSSPRLNDEGEGTPRGPEMEDAPDAQVMVRRRVESVAIHEDKVTQKVFDKLTDGNCSMTYDQWVRALRETFGLDLSEEELKRVWGRLLSEQHSSTPAARVDTNATLDFQSFAKGVSRMEFLRQIVNNVHGTSIQHQFEVPSDYDYDTYTTENYKHPADPSGAGGQFYGDYVEIRRTLDYEYHVNYSQERQLWQDKLVKSVVVRTQPQPSPWVVYTCGPMGAGKGYVFSWMSRHDYFPLENIVHIDPDYFKSVMPEWEEYARRSTRAGDFCHRESTFIEEIAQEEAMRNSQNVWVDGSLRDSVWYTQVFKKLRRKFPQYKIAIFVISVSETVVRERVAKRAKQTGRDVPEHMIEDSMRSVATSLEALTPYCDFVARIENESVPQLLAFERVDHSGNWVLIKNEFEAKALVDFGFPASNPPLVMVALDLQDAADMTKDYKPLFQVLNDFRDCVISNWSQMEPIFAELAEGTEDSPLGVLQRQMSNGDRLLKLSPAVPLRDEQRMSKNKNASILCVPDEAHSYCFIYPVENMRWESLRNVPEDVKHSRLAFTLLVGGFAYFDRFAELVAVHAISTEDYSEVVRRRLQQHYFKSFGLDRLPAIDSMSSNTSLDLPPAPAPQTLTRRYSSQRVVPIEAVQVPNLQFGRPVRLPQKAAEMLWEQDRCAPVTMAKFKERGARWFSYIKPGEMLPDMIDFPPLGAFAYLFRDVTGQLDRIDQKPPHHDVYFPLINQQL